MANIMALDDVLDATKLIKKILEKKGHSVAIFSEEDDAIAYVKDNPIDLAILDIKLKKMSGVDVLEELKKAQPDIRAIKSISFLPLYTMMKFHQSSSQNSQVTNL